jgi:hypothetical protein
VSEPIKYQHRMHPLSPNVSFTLDERTLDYEDEKGRSGSLPLHSIIHLRLTYDPGRIRAVKHVLEIATKDGVKLKTSSNTYAGMGMFKTRHAAFLAFLGPLVERVRKANPNVLVETGKGWTLLTGYLAIWVIFLGAIAWGVVLVTMAGQWAVGVMLAAMVAYFGMLGFDYARNNLPRIITQGPYPPEILPKPSENDV